MSYQSSRNDKTGPDRGARGIDGKKDVGFQNKGLDNKAINGMYGRAWAGRIVQSEGLNDVTGDSN